MMRLLIALLLLVATPASAILPTSTPTNTKTRTLTPTATHTRTSSSTATRTATPTAANTATQTGTVTATGTRTATPTAIAIYNADGSLRAAPVPMPTGACVVVLPDGKSVGYFTDGSGCAASGTPGPGGGNLESSGATSTRAVCLDEELAVTSGQSTATTTDTITAGSIVVKCVTRTNVAVSGGYVVGVANVPDAWGAAAGSLGDTNNLDVTMPGPTAVSTATAVVATSTHSSGQFQSSTGRIRVVCFCDEIGAPTE